MSRRPAEAAQDALGITWAAEVLPDRLRIQFGEHVHALTRDDALRLAFGIMAGFGVAYTPEAEQ